MEIYWRLYGYTIFHYPTFALCGIHLKTIIPKKRICRFNRNYGEDFFCISEGLLKNCF